MALIERNATAQSEDTKEAIRASILSNQIAVTNAEQQLRAYVTARDVYLSTYRGPGRMGAYGNTVLDGPVHTYGFAAILRNGGQTPATKVTINVSCQKLAKPLHADFDFPDSELFRTV